MRALASGFFCAFLIALALTPWIRRLALRLGALDQFSARKVVSKKGNIPRMGGIGIAVAFYATILFLWLSQSTVAVAVVSEGPKVVALLLGGIPILLLGGIDDLRGMRALTKLLVQTTVAAALWYIGLRIGGPLSLLPGSEAAEMPVWASFFATVLWITGIINAVNLIDGLDGLASGVAFFALGSTAITSLLRGDLVLCLFTTTLAGAVLGFLIFNWNPASIFMGDTGSMFLGYLLATTSIWTVQKSSTAVLIVFPAVALGLPLLDTSLTIGRRLLSGRPVMQADRDHVHHRLLGRGFTHAQAVMLLYGICAIFSGLSVAMALSDRLVAKFLLALAALFALGLAYVLGYVRNGPESIFHSLRQRGRNRALLQQLGSMSGSLSQAREVGELQAAVRDFALALGSVDLQLVLSDAPPSNLPGEGHGHAPDRETVKGEMPDLGDGFWGQGGVSYPIRAMDTVLGRIESRTAEVAITPDDRVLVQLLCDLLAPQLRRLTGRRSGRLRVGVPKRPVTDPSLRRV